MIYCFSSLFFSPTLRVARNSVDRVVAEVEDVGLYPTSQRRLHPNCGFPTVNHCKFDG
jgi:hypothetical protein